MAAKAGIEAVIWDFGGVFTSSPFEAFNRLEAEKGLPKDLIRRINATNHHDNAWALFERNEVDTEGFDAAVSRRSPRRLAIRCVEPRCCRSFRASCARGWWRR